MNIRRNGRGTHGPATLRVQSERAEARLDARSAKELRGQIGSICRALNLEEPKLPGSEALLDPELADRQVADSANPGPTAYSNRRRTVGVDLDAEVQAQVPRQRAQT